MDEDSRIQALESELSEVQEELKDILLDIRTYLMEAQSPIPNDMDRDKTRNELEGGRR